MRTSVLVLVLILVAGVMTGAWFLFRPEPSGNEASPKQDTVRRFCAACHMFPEPDSLPRRVWKEEIKKMYELAGLDKDIDVRGIPPMKETLRRYLEGAPQEVADPETYLGKPPGPLRFDRSGSVRQKAPGVSFLAYLRFPKERRNLIASDMRTGEVLLQSLHAPGKPVTVLARMKHPCLVEPVDLDGDGRRDLIVAELGSLLPDDHDRGKVVWLRAMQDGSLEPITLLDKVGRVADVSAADIDADGDLDLVVAEFGWRTTGSLLLLTNTGERDAGGVPRFETRKLDPRVGAINVPIVDIDGDGKLDIVVLFSQHFETVVAMLGDGAGGFAKRTIYEAPHPDWGCSGIEVTDLDGDGDLDVVLACGDTLDTGILHRHQGVYWLENKGTYPFVAHKLASHVGVHKVRAADLDGDGDLDLAASSFLPQLRQPGRPSPRLDSVIWIEQTSAGRFTPHPLEASRCDHAALEVGDFDGDGDIDIAVGNFLGGRPTGPTDWWTLFDNAGPR